MFPRTYIKEHNGIKKICNIRSHFLSYGIFFLNEINVFRVRPEGNRGVGERSKEPPGRDVPSQLFKWPFRGL